MDWIIAALGGAVLMAVGFTARFSSRQKKPGRRDEETLIASLLTTWMGS